MEPWGDLKVTGGTIPDRLKHIRVESKCALNEGKQIPVD
jgi:hypothetical protein